MSEVPTALAADTEVPAGLVPTGTVVVVTGGARGIGAELVEAYAAAGAKVVIADVLESGQRLADDLSARGAAVSFQHADVSDEASVQELAARCERELGRVDVLVNNASIYQDLGVKQPFTEITVEQWERVMRVNVTGLWLVTRALYPLMRERGYGRVVNIASSTVHMGVPNFAHYVASKGAVIALTRSLAKEVGASGVTVNAVAPGLVDNEASAHLNGSDYMPTAAKTRAIPRALKAQDLVGAVLFLSSPASAFVTGQTIVVDGGVVFS
jgi:NAD(P)-dependent dehydrogenase (short-subunit alcohol dehydrogenase family)